ncbi:MAG TPA: DUF5995 family protein [Aldersonia sp.]
MQATTIDDVIDILDTIVADTTARGDELGYFAALYRQVTVEVKRAIERGEFDDNPGMSRFDARFANRYFAAYDAYRSGGALSRSWRLAFDRTRSGRLLIVADLLVGINAHINLDLGVVAGTTYRGAALARFHDDFDHINTVLVSLLPRARAVVERFSPRLGELTALGGDDLALVLEFSVDVARDDAWNAARVVSVTPSGLLPVATETLDRKATLLGRIVADPIEPLASVVRHVQEAESTDVAAIITALDAIA